MRAESTCGGAGISSTSCPVPTASPSQNHARRYNGGGPEFTESTEQNQLEYIQKYVDSGLPYNCWWIDAGWYDCTLPDGTKFWPLTGNWYADKKRYPIACGPSPTSCTSTA